MAQFSRLTTEIDAILDDVEAAKEPYASLAARLYAIVGRFGGLSFEKLTKEQYDALETKDANTVYFVVSGNSVTMYLGTIKMQSGSGSVAGATTSAILNTGNISNIAGITAIEGE